MRLNQKGFAVSTILYGLVLVVSILLFLLLSIDSIERKSTTEYVKTISKELNKCVNNKSC